MATFVCGFESGTVNEIETPGAGVSIKDFGRWGSYCASIIASSVEQSISASSSNSKKSLYANFRIAVAPIVIVLTYADASTLTLTISESSGVFTATLVDDTTTIDESATVIVKRNSWFSVGIEVNGYSAKVFIDESPAISIVDHTVIGLRGAVDNFNIASSGYVFVDDIVYYEGAYKQYPLNILSLVPTRNMSGGGMTPGSNIPWHSVVNEIPPDEDTSYLSSTVDGSYTNLLMWKRYLLKFPGWRTEGILFLAPICRSKSASGTVKLDLRNPSFSHTGTAQAITASYAYYSEIWGSTGSRSFNDGDLSNLIVKLAHTGTTRTTQVLLMIVYVMGQEKLTPTVQGIDLHFTIPSQITDTESLYVITEQTFQSATTTVRKAVRFERDRTSLNVSTVMYYTGDTDPLTYEKITIALPATGSTYRVVFHDVHISVYTNDRWVHTFSGEGWAGGGTVTLMSTEDAIITDITLSELSDWRDAVYIDQEQHGIGAISSVIQERPVTIIPRRNTSLSFYYVKDRDILTTGRVMRHSIKKAASGASHYIVYYADVMTFVDTSVLEEDGFITRVIRVPNLGNGASYAAEMIARTARESRVIHNVEKMTLDPRLEIGDVLRVSYVLTGTDRAIDYDIIVDGISMNIADGDCYMSVQGREEE